MWDIGSSGREARTFKLASQGQLTVPAKLQPHQRQGVADVHIVGDLCSGRVMESHSLMLLTGAG